MKQVKCFVSFREVNIGLEIHHLRQLATGESFQNLVTLQAH